MIALPRRWLLGTLPGRVLVIGAVIKFVTAIAAVIVPPSMRVLDVVDAFGSLLLIFVALYAATRFGFWAKRRLLWRVRRKLILSYVFVGLVPGILIVSFFLLAGLIMFANVSSYLVQSRVRTLADQGRFLAQTVVLEAERETPGLSDRIAMRQRQAAERYPFTSVAIVPVQNLKCEGLPERRTATPAPMRIGWRHLDAPASLPRWINCDGFAGLLAYREPPQASGEEVQHLVMRAVALPQVPVPQWAVIVDVPFTSAIERRLREETGIELGAVTAHGSTAVLDDLPTGQVLEPGAPPDDGPSLGEGWVAFLEHVDWVSGATADVTVALRLNFAEIYDRLAGVSSNRVSAVLLYLLLFVGVLFLIIQLVALVIGFVLARQITGAVHDLFTGTEHLRNREFNYEIPVRARDQLGELAESFNLMTGEVRKLLKENAEKARMEQEMLAAREIQQKLLPSGPLSAPGLSSVAFCEPAREVAGDYYDFLPVSDSEVGILIADVSGKGLPAGLYMAQLKVIVQSLARVHRSPREFLIAVNRVVADNIDSKSFITMSYGVIDIDKREMTFARAGHCPLIHVPADAPPGMRKAHVLTPDGLVVGLKLEDDGRLFESILQEVTIPLQTDDLFVFFTDGVSETMNRDYDCYGEARLAKVLEQYAHLPFEQLRSFIFADLRSFSGVVDQHDDMTMVMLKVEPVPVLRRVPINV